MDTKWKYVHPTTLSNINDIEHLTSFCIPASLKAIILKYNNGRPEKCLFNTRTGIEREFKQLLSFNIDDIENIYIFINLFDKIKLFPFADDPAGNLICLDGESVVFWEHETETVDFIAESVDDFFNSLFN